MNRVTGCCDDIMYAAKTPRSAIIAYGNQPELPLKHQRNQHILGINQWRQHMIRKHYQTVVLLVLYSLKGTINESSIDWCL